MDTLENETWQRGITAADLDVEGRRRADLAVAGLLIDREPQADDQAVGLERSRESTTGRQGATGRDRPTGSH